METLAQKQGGHCLSQVYVNNRTKLRWSCIQNHVWEAVPSSVLKGHWCPRCASRTVADKKKIGIQKIQGYAEKKGGKVLSEEYVDQYTKIKIQCSEGHIWWPLPTNLLRGHWCPKCSGVEKLSITFFQNLAIEKGGGCLSEHYQNNMTKLKFECKKLHQWDARPADIKRGKWCPFCVGRGKTIDEMHAYAKSKKGKCLSEVFRGVDNKLLWRCEEAHIWEATPYHTINRGQWCPICASGLGERICRAIFERLLNEKFPKVRPDWLLNARGGRMELDGYSKKLSIAFEYQGQQHYQSSHFFHRNGSIEQRKEDDQQKRDLCKKHRILLIGISYTIEYEKMGDFIAEELLKNSIVPPVSPSTISIQELDVFSPHPLRKMQEVAMAKGGQCLSEKYIDRKYRLKFKCKRSHVWSTTPSSISMGTWCPICAIKYRNSRP